MMTIKEFARLCGCNPQTLRYYDHVDLLKPVKVDEWTGYRFYTEDQSLIYVKIRNLQKAGFTIEEIKELLDQNDEKIYQAFEMKIAEEERRIREIREIQQTYRADVIIMQNKIEELRQQIKESLNAYDPAEEFGMDQESYASVISSVESALKDLAENIALSENASNEETDGKDWFADCLNDPDNQVLYESHAWENAKDFMEEMPDMNAGEEYLLLFQLMEDKTNKTAFANVALAKSLEKVNGRAYIECRIVDSTDGKNHFYLVKCSKTE